MDGSSQLLGLDATASVEDITITLTAKPHAFGGAVLSPKHARELTPQLCLAIASALSEQACQKISIPYTLWITEAWRVLGWAEPSAALFWEMATMYHTLYLAGRALVEEYEVNKIPPILSCGSQSSYGSLEASNRSGGGNKDSTKKFSTAASAKELPVWLVGTFLLLHCEESAFLRNLSGQDERRFYNNVNTPVLGDFHSLLGKGFLSPRTRMHAGWNDQQHCTSYLLRHLRKVLLLTAVPHNSDALRACMHLAALPVPQAHQSSQPLDSEEIRRRHEEEHGKVGTSVRLCMEDLARLHFILQPPSGGGVDDPPLQFGDFLWSAIYNAPMPADPSIPLGEVEREIRRHLEAELQALKGDKEEQTLTLAKLSLEGESERAKQPQQGDHKELTYNNFRGTTVLLKPSEQSETRLHDLVVSECSDVHMYLLQPFEHVTIAACTGCTIVVGAVAGLLHVVDCEKTTITSAARRILVSNSCDVLHCIFTPSPPLLVGDNRNCQFAPYNSYYDGMRDDLLSTGLAAAVLPENQSPRSEVTVASWPPLQCASNKWNHPVELSKLEIPQVGGNALPPSDDKSKPQDDAAMQTPVLLPASEFDVLFVPIVSEGKQHDETIDGSQYCRLLAEVLQLSPFRLPVEYERQVTGKADRVRNLQLLVKKNLTEGQQRLFEEELNRGFRDWLVTSGNLRQVLDLVHLERRGDV